MATDMLIIILFVALGALFTIVGLGNRKTAILGLVGGVIFLMIAGVLGNNQSLIMGYLSDGTPITQSVTGEMAFMIGVIGVSVMILSGLRETGKV